MVAIGLHQREVDAQFPGARADGGGRQDGGGNISPPPFQGWVRGGYRRSRCFWLNGGQLALLATHPRPLPGREGSINGGLDRFDRRRGHGNRPLAFRLDLHQHRSDRHLIAGFTRQTHDGARDRAFHLDRRLVGHHVGDRLVFLDPVADLDVPADNLRLRNAFADVRQLECEQRHYIFPRSCRGVRMIWQMSCMARTEQGGVTTIALSPS
jgi:hypothetical protein